MTQAKPIQFIGSSLEDLKEFPLPVKKEMGHALNLAQNGMKHPDAKPMKGFGGAGVLEIVENFDGDTFRGVYTVRFEGVVYVLHCFQKKSTKGISTPQADIALIKARLKRAEADYNKLETR